MRSAIRCVGLARAIGNAPAFASLTKREAKPGDLDAEMDGFIRDAKSVVDSTLKVYRIDRLRVADASVVPRVTSGNTMAPCVGVGERAAQLIRAERQA